VGPGAPSTGPRPKTARPCLNSDFRLPTSVLWKGDGGGGAQGAASASLFC
jgi:hypothetical protein